MFDLNWLIENLDLVIKKLSNRNGDFTYLYELKDLVEERKKLLNEGDLLKNKRNQVSKQIGEYKRNKKDPKELLESVANIGNDISNIDLKIKEIEDKIRNIQLVTPNIPHESVPIGKDENYNKEIRKFGKIRKFNFEIKDHVDLGIKLDIFDFDRAAKVCGTRFVFDKGLGAKLERSLIQFMLDTHAKDGFIECIPPYIINEESMYGTGQLPKFKEDAYKLENTNWYLNPTAEVPMINMYRDEIMDNKLLPLCFAAYTTAFRSEAGSAGRDTRGILRQHQFHKVELIKFTRPEDSYNELEKMLMQSEKILQLLNLPYRVVCLSTGDMGFGMAKTYDIEVWIPSQNKYREIGSISNAEAYQARRANIRFKRDKDSKTEYVHTLNGSGLAVGRTMIAIIENYQNEDGTINIPEVLIPYMGVDKIK